MNTRKLWLIMTLVMVFAMAGPTFGRQIPWFDRSNPGQLDDHPWGGDLMAGGNNDNFGGTFSLAFVGTPLSFIDFFRMMFFTGTRNDLPLIRGSANQINDLAPTNSIFTNSTFIPGKRQRGN